MIEENLIEEDYWVEKHLELKFLSLTYLYLDGEAFGHDEWFFYLRLYDEAKNTPLLYSKNLVLYVNILLYFLRVIVGWFALLSLMVRHIKVARRYISVQNKWDPF